MNTTIPRMLSAASPFRVYLVWSDCQGSNARPDGGCKEAVIDLLTGSQYRPSWPGTQRKQKSAGVIGLSKNEDSLKRHLYLFSLDYQTIETMAAKEMKIFLGISC